VCPADFRPHHAAGLNFRPPGYGIKTFDLGSRGRFAPAIVSGPADLNLSTYAAIGSDKNLQVTLINNPARFRLSFPPPWQWW
jgi:hypothetical protein